MTIRHRGWVAIKAIACLLLLSFVNQSCARKATRGPDGELVLSCDEQIEELRRWLAHINGYNMYAHWGQKNYDGDLVEIDIDLPPVMGITPFVIRDDRFETCRGNQVLFEKPENQIEKFREIAYDCRNTRITLYISPEAGWESIVRVCEGIMRSGIFEVYFVFDSSEKFSEKPPDSPFGRKIELEISKAKQNTEPGKEFVVPVSKLVEHLKECPQVKKAFHGFENREEYWRIMKLDSKLPEAMEACDCVPPLSNLKSVIWPMVWVGRQRVSLLVRLALTESSDCHEISQDCIEPWSEAHKEVVEAAKKQKGEKIWAEIYKGKPLCFVSRPLQHDKITPMKFDLPMIQKRKARIKKEYEKLQEEIKNQIKGEIQTTDGPQKADHLFRLAELYYYKSRLENEKELKEYDAKLKKWEEEVKINTGAPKPVVNNRGSRVWIKAAFDIYRVILKNYKDYHRRDEVLFVFAYSLLETGDKQKGVDMYRQLLEEYPKSRYVGDTYLALGEHFFDSGDYESAVKEYEKSATYEGTKASFLARYKLAWCYLRLGDKAIARDLMKRVAAEAKSEKLRGRANRELVTVFAE